MSTILVADDNHANRELVCAILQRAGFDVAEAKDGHDALRKLSETKPDLLLLDIHMPGIDGYGVLRNLRQDAQLSHLPVVALTASAMTGDEEEALRQGFDAYLAKPYEVPEVVELVRKMLQR